MHDVERVRAHLGIERWMVFGGSWGSTLALAYAQSSTRSASPSSCCAASSCCASRRSTGSTRTARSASFPDAWEDYLAPIPVDERGDLMRGLPPPADRRRQGARSEAARAWSVWEGGASCLVPNPDAHRARPDGDDFSLAFARIENHYFVHHGFFARDRSSSTTCTGSSHIPGVIVQGRYDIVCPMRSALGPAPRVPGAELVVNQRAGHSMFDPENTAALVEACDRVPTSPV